MRTEKSFITLGPDGVAAFAAPEVGRLPEEPEIRLKSFATFFQTTVDAYT
jgi:hypothetical protein